MHLSNITIASLRAALVFTVLIVSNVAIGAGSVAASDEKHMTECGKTDAIQVAIGWTLIEAEQKSPSLSRTETPGFNAGLSAYVSKPASFKYVGGVPFEISCPHMVSVMPMDGHVAAVEVGFVADDPYDLDQAMKLMATWRDKFASMNLSAPSNAMKNNVVSFDEVRFFFHLKAGLNLSPIGQSVGVWQRGSEVVGIGIERWNVAPLNLLPKYMYIVEINVSNQALFKIDK